MIIRYKCTVCEREIDVNQDPKTPDVFGKCIITNNCKGYLYRIGEKKRILNIRPPAVVAGLDDWIQRRSFYIHHQNVKSSTWIINHNLNNIPVVVLWVYKFDYSLKKEILVTIDESEYEIIFSDLNTLEIRFKFPYSGVVHLLVKDTNVKRPEEKQTITPIEFDTLGPNATLTFAFSDTLVPFLNPVELDIDIYSPKNGNLINTIRNDINFHKILQNANSPWSFVSEIVIAGQKYYVGSVSFNPSEIENGSAVDIKVLNVSYDPRDIYLLLSVYPHSSNDIDKDNAILYNSIDNIQNNFFDYVLFRDGEFLVNNRMKTKLYPPILIAR